MSVTVRRLRKAQNMTQVELAKKVRVTQGYISQVEAGTKKELGQGLAVKSVTAEPDPEGRFKGRVSSFKKPRRSPRRPLLTLRSRLFPGDESAN
jgi:transcriptional regulator with XRE-family HTH domain